MLNKLTSAFADPGKPERNPSAALHTLPTVGRRYALLESIGSGNMGTVYRSVDRLTGQTVALKQVKVSPEQLVHGSRGSENDDATLALAQEFKILASLRHPNIISVLDYGFQKQQTQQTQSASAPLLATRPFGPQVAEANAPIGGPYVTMELLENAQDFMEYGAQLPTELQIELLVQVLQALVYLHRRGILHRDLKPKNVLVVGAPADALLNRDDADEINPDADTVMSFKVAGLMGMVKVLDFGLSVHSAQADSGEVAGTPSYMAPEVWNGRTATRASDLYAVGIMAYRLFAGAHPFDTSNLRKLFYEVQSKAPELTKMRVPPPLQEIVGKLLAKAPADRYQDAADVIAAFRAATGQTLVAETAETRESFLQAATFVGRDQEMDNLVALMAKAGAGQGSAWLVGGESGVGKSRLLDELRTRALVENALVLRGSANAGDANNPVPYDVWRSILAWLTLLADVTDEMARTLKPIVPNIDQLLGREIKETEGGAAAASISAQDLQAGQSRLFAVVETMIREAAGVAAKEGQALVFMLEDLHWADAQSLLLLQHVARLAPSLPLLLIGTFRDDEMPGLPAKLPEMSPISLHRLTPTQTAELAEAMLGAVGRNRELLHLLQRETEGNTFFLVELVRALAEEAGELTQIGNAPLPMHVLTSGMSSIIQRRLNRITPQAKPLLLLAAVAGRQLDLDVMREALRELGSRARMDSWLSACADAAVLDVQDGMWRFAHAKLRDGVLSELRPEVVRDLNGRVANAIETVYQYSSKQTAATLAYHWRMVGNTEKEEHYAALAGEQALRNGATHAAQVYLRRALELQPAESEANRRKRATLKQQLGDAYAGEGQRATAEAYYQEALALFRAANYRWGVSTALNRLGNLAGEAGDLERGAKYLIEALQTAYESRALQVAVASLVAMAGLLERAGAKETALEYVALALNHPSLDVQTGEVARRLWVTLRETVPNPDDTIERGRARELKEVITRILEG